MNKKTFLGGVVTGVAVTAISVSLLNIVPIEASATVGGKNSISSKIGYIIELLDSKYVDQIDREEILESGYRGLVAGVGDPYTAYLSQKQVEAFRESNEGSFYGVGINILADEVKKTLTVVSPIKGSPAEAAGVKPGDIIFKVNEEEVIGLDSDYVISQIKGEEGTTVDVTMKRGTEDVEFQLTRESISVPTAEGRMLEGKIGYIELSGFKQNTYDQFSKEYDKLMAEGATGLIVDVRDNPGGLLDSVTAIVDKLIPEGIITYTVDKMGEREDHLSQASAIEVPLVVLVNGNSASASEILAGAVQDSKTGELVGTQTFGKGLVQGLFSIPDGSALKITVQKYYTPNGVCIQGEGIAPNHIVDLPEGLSKYKITDDKEDTQLQKAIEVINSKK